MAFISEAGVEAALLDQLEGLGYTRLPDGIAGPVPPIYLIRGASRTPTGPPALVMAPSSL